MKEGGREEGRGRRKEEEGGDRAETREGRVGGNEGGEGRVGGEGKTYALMGYYQAHL